MSSPRSYQVKQLPDSILTESEILAKKLPLTTWNNLNPSPTVENQKKYHNKLMKPLQVNHRRKLLTLASNKNHQKWVDEPLPEMGYEELLSKVSEIKKISKLQEKALGLQDTMRIRSRTPKESSLKINLTQDAVRCIELARESAIMQTEGNISRTNISSSVENRVNSNSNAETETIGKHENRQKRLATQLSNQLDKKVPKQLNSNAHFRHTKRKVLLLRALDSVVNQKEVVKDHYSSVKSCREINELTNISKEPALDCYVSPSLVNLRPSSKGRDSIGTPVSKIVGESEQQQHFYLPGGSMEPEQRSSLDATISRLFTRVPMSENYICSTPKAKSKTVIMAQKKSPVGSISHFLKDNEYFNNSQEIEKSLIQGNQIEKDEKIMRIPTIDSIVLDFHKSHYIPSKSQFYSSDDETCQRNLAGFSGTRKKNKMKERLMAEIKEKKENTFKNELKLTMRNEPVIMSGQISYTLRSSKSVSSLKHIRRVSQSVERRAKKKDSYWGTPIQARTPREKSENAKESMQTRRTVQELIDKGFREESTDKELGKREAETILNSYGFKDVDESLRKSRMKPRFSTLEGYQGAFLKEALAKTQRYMDNVMRKENKLDKIL